MLAILATLTTLTPYSLTARAERAIDPCARANLRRAARLAAQCIGSTFAELCLNDPVLQLCIKRSCRAAGPMPARPWCDVLASGWREGEQHDGHSGKHEASGWRRTAGRRVHVRRVAACVLGSRGAARDALQTTCHVKGGNTCITTCLSRTKHQWLIDEHSLQRYPGRNRHPPRRLRSGHVPSLFPFLCNRLQERSSYSELATASRNVL